MSEKHTQPQQESTRTETRQRATEAGRALNTYLKRRNWLTQ